jgi:site-specific DNA-methyltransferase (adenine-specific)
MPYYADESVTLYHGDCREVLATLGDQSVDCVITDPPYDSRTHGGALTNKGGAKGGAIAVDFAAFTHERQLETFVELGRITRGWVIATLATSTAFRFDLDPPPGLRSLRVGVWVKPNPMPQISGDRPGMGWEPVMFMHRIGGRPKWNGGGKAGVWSAPVAQNEGHPTAKPLAMVRDWVQLFTNPGDLILDPFAGSGTTLRAALDEGRKAIGVELEERYCEVIAKRLAQGVLDFGSAS